MDLDIGEMISMLALVIKQDHSEGSFATIFGCRDLQKREHLGRLTMHDIKPQADQVSVRERIKMRSLNRALLLHQMKDSR